MSVTNKTQLNLVIGYPLGHTQSPVLHEAVYQLLGINAVLLAKPHLQLDAMIRAIKTLSVGLTAVTLPYKEKVIKYMDRCSPEVKALKAANTIIQRNGKLHGYNTDVDGISFALRDIALEDKRVLVIGAGGAARALGYFLRKNRAQICWINRTRKRALTLAKEFGGDVLNPNDLDTLHMDIIINTTPVGLYPHDGISPLPDYVFNAQQVVFDMIYNPVMTQLLKRAQRKRATIISGLDMFIGQGLKQIELLTGKHIKDTKMVDEIRKVIIKNQQMRRT